MPVKVMANNDVPQGPGNFQIHLHLSRQLTAQTCVPTCTGFGLPYPELTTGLAYQGIPNTLLDTQNLTFEHEHEAL